MCRELIMGNEKIESMAIDGYLETRDVADLLNITIGTVHYFLREGKLKADSGSVIKNQRKKIPVEEFKKFLNGNRKYYSRIYGTTVLPTVSEPKEVEQVTVTSDSEIMIELFNKMEAIEAAMKQNRETIEKLTKQNEELESQRAALEKVIDMF